jgi:predicted negative regulator of RcsB-dependent stress response
MEKIKQFWHENTKAILIVVGALAAYFVYTKIKQNK